MSEPVLVSNGNTTEVTYETDPQGNLLRVVVTKTVHVEKTVVQKEKAPARPARKPARITSAVSAKASAPAEPRMKSRERFGRGELTERLFEAVAASPGIHVDDVMRQVGVNRSSAVYRLKARGLITITDGLCYPVAGVSPPKFASKARIIEAVTRFHGLKVSELAEKLKADPVTPYQWRNRGYIEIRDGRCYPVAS